MRTKHQFLSIIALFCMAGSVVAQEPLTVIDWLGQPDQTTPLPETILLEPPVTGSAARPEITVTPLEALLPPIGLVPPAATGLPVDLWRGSRPEEISRLIASVPVRNSPAMQSLLFTVILSESRPIPGAHDAILLARLDRLIELGATDPAQALVEQAGPTETPERFERWFDTTLLSGDEDRSCAALVAAPFLSSDYSARIFCSARRGDWPTAALMLETAHALELLPSEALNVLDRFLNPDIFELAPPLPMPSHPSPLTYRMYEAIGERLPSAPLPRAFAAADLRDVAGWKAQLEAAERLTRVGALNPNQLLGLYTARSPAASGGIWDRVAALQRFETALGTQNSEAISKTLPLAWSAMQEAGLEVAFSDLFSNTLARIPLSGKAAELAWRIRLLSPNYEIASHGGPSDSDDDRFLAGLAQGAPFINEHSTQLQLSIAAGFAEAEVPAEIARLTVQGQLGEAILRSMVLFARGQEGNLGDLSVSLAALRSMGLEDSARRAALQILLLDRR